MTDKEHAEALLDALREQRSGRPQIRFMLKVSRSPSPTTSADSTPRQKVIPSPYPPADLVLPPDEEIGPGYLGPRRGSEKAE